MDDWRLDIASRMARGEEKDLRVERDIAEIKDDLRIIRDALVAARGGRKMLAAWIVAAGAAGSFLPWLLGLFQFKH